MNLTKEGLSYHSLRIKGGKLLPEAYYHGGNVLRDGSACRVDASLTSYSLEIEA